MLTMREMKYKFEEEEPVNDEFIDYMQCLMGAHNELLFKIQDPTNIYQAMESNPINSKDVQYGVPAEFRQILDQIIEIANEDDDDFEEPIFDDYEDYQLPQVEVHEDETLIDRMSNRSSDENHDAIKFIQTMRMTRRKTFIPSTLRVQNHLKPIMPTDRNRYDGASLISESKITQSLRKSINSGSSQFQFMKAQTARRNKAMNIFSPFSEYPEVEEDIKDSFCTDADY